LDCSAGLFIGFHDEMRHMQTPFLENLFSDAIFLRID
jgi:hypothetical protein